MASPGCCTGGDGIMYSGDDLPEVPYSLLCERRNIIIPLSTHKKTNNDKITSIQQTDTDNKLKPASQGYENKEP